MTKKIEARTAAATRDGPLVIVDLRERVPAMSDGALATLHDNAKRLVVSGQARQRAAAEALLPTLELELAARAAKALAERLERKAGKKTSAARSSSQKR
jgi:hypothetical protein